MRCFPLTLSTSFNYVYFHAYIGVGVGEQYIGLLQDMLLASESALPALSDPFFSPLPPPQSLSLSFSPDCSGTPFVGHNGLTEHLPLPAPFYI